MRGRPKRIRLGLLPAIDESYSKVNAFVKKCLTMCAQFWRNES